MRLSEWQKAAEQGAGPEAWGRLNTARTLESLFSGQDPMVYGTVAWGTEQTDPVVVTLLAPFKSGLATATASKYARTRLDTVDVSVIPWTGLVL